MLNKKTFKQTALYMDTVVSLKVVSTQSESIVEDKMQKAFDMFHNVEKHCSRFDPNSELRRLSSAIGEPQHVSPILFQAVLFAREMAKLTKGAFDPTIGYTLEVSGFNENYLTGESVSPSFIDSKNDATYEAIQLNTDEHTITLQKPMILDLGAVAKGLAIDLAAKELQEFEGFYIDAGGDIYVGGLNENDQPWTVGIRHPYEKEKLIKSVQLTDTAICTSGSYERISKVKENTHHLINPISRRSVTQLLSCTVIAPFAMLADAFSTATFILGEQEGKKLLEDNELGGLLVTPSMQKIPTRGFEKYDDE